MNAHQRAVHRKAIDAAQSEIEARIATAERRAANAQVLLESVEEERARLVKANQELRDERRTVEARLAVAEFEAGLVAAGRAETLRLCEMIGTKDAQLKQYERELARLESEDRDAAKLRRRLKERGDELAAAHQRIRDLEAEVKAGATIVLARREAAA